MRNEFAFGYGRFITSGAHLLLLVAGLRIATRPGWIFCLAAITVISLFVWTVDFRRTRAVADTPTSRVASAPQGYVELFGRAGLLRQPRRLGLRGNGRAATDHHSGRPAFRNPSA